MSYDDGLDILGVGVGDFLPWLNVISSAAGAAGGATGGKSNPISSIIPGSSGQSSASSSSSKSSGQSTQEIVKAALEDERRRQATEKALADARKMKWVAAGAIGVLGLGALVLVLRR